LRVESISNLNIFHFGVSSRPWFSRNSGNIRVEKSGGADRLKVDCSLPDDIRFIFGRGSYRLARFISGSRRPDPSRQRCGYEVV
jgi:hypothetical protein